MANDSSDLKKKYGGGEFSYLYWPCSMDFPEGQDLHITAKFLGKEDVDPEEVFQLIGEFPGLVEESGLRWKPVVFDTKNDDKVSVLQLVEFPESMSQIHDALAGLRKDDYPDYKPHITVPQALWDLISLNEWQPKDVGLIIYPIELKVKGEIFRPKI